VADRGTKQPFPRADRATERVIAAAKAGGLLLYPSTGCADGTNGDLVMIGPPFTLPDDEADLLVERTVAAIGTLAE
jgi:adenosylmethionine-8-amino-7-oxononanoate aminotransferase